MLSGVAAHHFLFASPLSMAKVSIQPGLSSMKTTISPSWRKISDLGYSESNDHLVASWRFSQFDRLSLDRILRGKTEVVAEHNDTLLRVNNFNLQKVFPDHTDPASTELEYVF